MFESPQQPKQTVSGDTGRWVYLEELEAMADWLTVGSDRSPALATAVAEMDTFRGPETVKRWLHNLATGHVPGEEAVAAYLDDMVEGKRLARAPGGRALGEEITARLAWLESLCTIPDNYRCALLLKEGSGLTVDRTAFLMGVSQASLRSILYRTRRSIGA